MKSIIGLPKNLAIAWSPLKTEFSTELAFNSGLRSTKFIPKHTEIFKINQWISGQFMSILDIARERIITDVLEFVAEINPEVDLFLDRLKIAHQLSFVMRDPTLDLHPFVSSINMPHQNYPLYWTNSQSTASESLKQILSEEYLLLRNSYDKIFSIEKGLLSKITFEEFLWNHVVTSDLSTIVNNHYDLVPIFDIFPHSFDSNTRAIKEPDSILIVSTKNIPENTLLTRDYGPYDNYTYVLKHGFFPENNPHHKISISPEEVREWPEILTKMRINDKSLLEARQNSEGFSMNSLKKKLMNSYNSEGILGSYLPIEPPAALTETILRIIFLSEKDMDLNGIQDYSQVLNLDFNKPISENNERNVRIMLFKCSEYAKEYFLLSSNGNHPVSKKLEDCDVEIAKKHMEYYKKLLGLSK